MFTRDLVAGGRGGGVTESSLPPRGGSVGTVTGRLLHIVLCCFPSGRFTRPFNESAGFLKGGGDVVQVTPHKATSERTL